MSRSISSYLSRSDLLTSDTLKILTFLSAFLLFQIELIAAKILLPRYGGSFMVWGACMVFFQAILLLGYCFSHVLLSSLGMVRYRNIYLGLLFLPLLFFPGKDFVVVSPNHNVLLAFDVFGQLFVTIGPVFFVLSTISVVTQVWLAESKFFTQNNPYVLYSWSNAGSFAGLLTYPFVFEYFFNTSTQLLIWRVCYFVLILLSVVAYFRIPLKSVSKTEEKEIAPPSKEQFVRWFLLSAGGVIMFLSVTNILTMTIAPFPLLWIIPLGIYLLAFVLNFKEIPWCPGWITRHIHLYIGIGLLLYFLSERRALPIAFNMIVLIVLLFVLCMYCQNQLVKSRPVGNKNLTFFYLMLSFGGFVGGMVTSWLMPMVSTSVLEFVLGLAVIGLTVKPVFDHKEYRFLALAAILLFIVSLFLWPLAFHENNFVGVSLIVVLTVLLFKYINRAQNAFALVMILIMMLASPLETLWGQKNYLLKKRNYYGTYKIYDYGGVRSFMHGTTLHGLQILDPDHESQPTSYFGLRSPVADILNQNDVGNRRIGIIGLGAGTLAAYGRAGERMDFYELDPEVYTIANRYFSFIKKSPAQLEYYFGDARLALENHSERYDVLIVDAFSGDAIPVHLLTQEMLAEYRAHLNPDGIVLFHVTNRYINAGLIAGRSALSLGAKVGYKSAGQSSLYELHSDWIAVTWSEPCFAKLTSQLGWKEKKESEIGHVRLWTDQYSNILPVIKYEEFFRSLSDLKIR